MSLLFSGDMVLETIQNYTSIKKEFKKHKDYLLNNPWLVTITNNVSFEEVISFKEKFFVDSYEKIYQQIKLKNPDLINKGPQIIYYYKFVPGLYEKQKREGGELGERDNEGRLITGANLILVKQGIELSKFLSFYYTTHN